MKEPKFPKIPGLGINRRRPSGQRRNISYHTKRALFILLLSAFLGADSYALYRGDVTAEKMPPAPTRLIVKFKADTPLKVNKSADGAIIIGSPDIDKLNRKYSITNLAPMPGAAKTGQSPERFRNIYLLPVDAKTDIEIMMSDYKNCPDIEYAEPDYTARFYRLPDDSLYALQWNLNNIGQGHYHIQQVSGSYNDKLITVNGLPGSDISADSVFQAPPDNTLTVVVAILDTGADMKHPDLADNIWVNPREITANGLDDDNNGYIDDINGWDFSGSGEIVAGEDNDPTDNDGHGTHCAGIVAAVINNSLGIAGIAPNCRIMPLKIDPLPLTTKIAAAIIYAADNGVSAINMSFGLAFPSQLIEDALDYARSKGVVLCAAAGNDYTETVNYPAGFSSVIAIGATTDSDRVASFSTYGDHIAVVAPGLSILSLRAAGTDMYAPDYPYEPKVHIIDSLYYIASGTSMACPHVVGVAAYLQSVSPGLTPQKTTEILEQTADDYLDPYGVGWNLPGHDKYSGYGRIDLLNALSAAPQIRARITSPTPNEIVSGQIDISGFADGAAFSEYIAEYGSGTEPNVWTSIAIGTSPVSGSSLASWNTIGLSGRYTLRLKVGEDNISNIPIAVANDTIAEIISPLNGDSLVGSTAIMVNGFCPNFGQLLLEYGAGSPPTIWDTIAISSVPIFGEQLAEWIVEDIPAGDYTLRLSVNSKSGPLAIDSIFVHIKSIFSTGRAWKTKLGATASIISNYGDFNGDGQNEIIVGTSAGIKVLNLDGEILTSGFPAFPIDNFAIPIAVGNLDGDGIDDIVAVGYDPPMVYGYPSGAPAFRNYLGILPGISSNFYTEHQLPKVFLKDTDGDGQDEIHVYIYNGSQSKSFLFDSDGTLVRAFDYFSTYLPADLNGDGIDEIYVGNEQYGLIKQYNIADSSATDSLLIQMNGSAFHCQDISAYDIDGDNKSELIVYGSYNDYGFWLYAFDDGFHSVPGWPHDMKINDFVLPTTPIFGDIDNDGSPEYFSTYFDLSASYILAWNIDGTTYLPWMADGLFSTVPGLSILNMLLLSDMNDDGAPELLACAINDAFFTYEVQRIYSWDKNADILPGFPIVVAKEVSTYLRYTPSIGDIDKDGNVDLLLTTADSALVFIDFPQNPYRLCGSPVPFWRYNRAMNNVGVPSDTCNSVDAPESHWNLPAVFSLLQNYPNPFNPATTIDYSILSRTYVTISVYNILGQKIKMLVDGIRAAGQYSIDWDGTDSEGKTAASGIYFYRIKAGEFSQSRKMVILK